MDDLLELTAGKPQRVLDEGEVLVVDGDPVAALYVLVDGRLRIDKGGETVAVVAERGACVGEMSLLLGTLATADVVAAERSTVAVFAEAGRMLDGEGGLGLALARLLAGRLQVMTTYLADLKHQYRDHEGGLGMVDVVLTNLMGGPGARTRLGSERDLEPEY